METTKKTFGGKQDGAGRPAKDPEEKVIQRTLYLPPDLDGRLIDSVGNERGAVVGEIVRILKLYYDKPKII
jgi:hypothetical protein